jgi:hypothetical protein
MVRSLCPVSFVVWALVILSGDGRCADKPTYTDRFNGGSEEAEYVLEQVTRNGREVTLTLNATLTKGPEKRELLFFGVNLVDTDGNSHKARINANGARSRPEKVTLNAGVKTKVTIRFPLDPKVTKVQLLEVTMSAVERVAIKFSDLEIPAK